MRAATTILLAAAVSLAAACGGDEGGGSASDVIEAWKSAGLQPTTFETADGQKFGGGKCRAGNIGGLDATLCEYADETAARAAEGAGRSAIGENTGVSLAAGKVLLVVADRKNADPNGRRINQIAKTFQKRAR
jgi:hypothetical protein